MRGLLVPILACLVLDVGGDRLNSGVPKNPVATKEIPRAWRLEDIADASPPRSDGGPVYVLAWKILEDNRPLGVEYCLVLKELKKPSEKKDRWVLARLGRNPAEGKEWNIETIWITPDPEFKNPPFIMHLQEYQNRPTNSGIYKFMDKYLWHLGSDKDWKVLDGGICAAWEKVIGEKPVRSFKQ